MLRPGGVFVNVDHMPDEGLPGLSERLADRARVRRESRYAAGAVLSWADWWRHAAADPTLNPLVPERARVFGERHSSETDRPARWHVEALRAAGFAEAGIVWRGGVDAAASGVR